MDKNLLRGVWLAFGVGVMVWAGGLGAGEEDLRPLRARAGLAPFVYTNAPEVMPNYLSGEQWGTEGGAISEMQLPLTPEESARHMVVQAGFEVALWASEPDVVKPIALAWDEAGRLWIAETLDYPNELKPDGEGGDRIKICEDTDGNGRADKFTVFADKLSIPTSLCFANGGLVVIENGQTLFLKDTDGDDVADERRVLFRGWGTGDTHATASNLRYGLDNWIWGTVGYSGFNGEVGGEKLRFGQGIYRFKPDGSKLEFIQSSNNNTWGLGITEDGTIAGSTANNNASWYMAIPNRYYEAVRGWSPGRMESIADSQAFHPITGRIRQVDLHGKYTAGAGHAVYTARSFPREYWNRIAFVAEPTGHLVGFFRLDRVGADYRAINLGSFLASDDEWTAPIVAEVGPEGAVWVIDWYNYIVQHNPTPIGFKTGKGNAYETRLRDQRHGRIYRVTHRSGERLSERDLTGPRSVVYGLSNPNQLWRMHAQRVLVERGEKDVVGPLLELVRNRQTDGVGLNVGAVHALWTLHGLGVMEGVEGAVIEALGHPSAAVRRAAVNVLGRTEAVAEALRRRGMLADSDAQVRLAAYLALAEMPVSRATAKYIHDSLKDPANAGDRWLREGAAAAAARHESGFVPIVLLQGTPMPEGADEVTRVVMGHYARRSPEGVAAVLAAAAGTAAGNAMAVLDGLIDGWPEKAVPEFTEQDIRRLKQAIGGLPEEGKERFLVLARKWDRLDLFPSEVTAAMGRLTRLIGDSSAEAEARELAARNLVRLRDREASVAVILGEVTLRTPPELGRGLLRALGESQNPATGSALLARFGSLTPGQKTTALDTLLRRGEWAGQLLGELEAGRLHPKDLGWQHWQRLRSHLDPEIARRAAAAEGRQPVGSAELEQLVKRFLPVAGQQGDIARGKEVYTQNCAVCHRFYGEGGKVGPDLSGIGARPRVDILADILDPNRSVEANYRLWTVETKDGESISGRLDSETQTSIELYELTGEKRAVERKEIEEISASALSIMPAGFEALGEADLAALLEFMAAGVKR